MELTIEEMRAVCVAHYVERRHTPVHADLIVPKVESEIRRIYGCIQKEQNSIERQKNNAAENGGKTDALYC